MQQPASPARRRALQFGLGLGAGLALARSPLAMAGTLTETLAEASAGNGLIQKAIPSTGELLPVIGIGTARCYDVGESDYERAPLREVLDAFARMGGRVVDTAPSYGRAEAVVGDLVASLGNRDKLFLATKVGAGRDGREAGLAEMARSFERLRTARIDLLQIHNLAGVEHMLPVLREWKQEGRIRYLGVSTSFKPQYEALERLMRHEALDFVQIDYAIDNREAEERILPLAAERGMAVLVNLPFGRGRVFEAFHGHRIPDWATELGIASWAQFVLKYVVSHPAVTCAIPGTATLRYLEDNLAAARGQLPDAATRRRMVALIEVV